MSIEQSIVIQELRASTPSASSLLLAVSGGADSMALLEGYSRICEHRIEVAHVNHNLRSTSTADSEFVQEKCRELGVLFHSSSINPPDSGNLEQWGRRERYKFFAQVRQRQGLDLVVTAHTSNDSAETLLMRLVSNKDLRGILRYDESRSCLRPLLSVSRVEVENFLESIQSSWLNDESNDDLSFLRNRVRHELIPFLDDKFDGDMLRILAERAQAVQMDLEVLDATVVKMLEEVKELDWGSKPWLRRLQEVLLSAEENLRWRIAEQVLLPELMFRIGVRRAGDVVGFLLGDAVGLQLPGGVELRRSGGGILLSSKRNAV